MSFLILYSRLEIRNQAIKKFLKIEIYIKLGDWPIKIVKQMYFINLVWNFKKLKKLFFIFLLVDKN